MGNFHMCYTDTPLSVHYKQCHHSNLWHLIYETIFQVYLVLTTLLTINLK
uniref:Uncharacterized protein n=1 Tax=Octopus bimaculoides TaxID=37653 RepID=A0A0L8I7Y7_OCTBM